MLHDVAFYYAFQHSSISTNTNQYGTCIPVSVVPCCTSIVEISFQLPDSYPFDQSIYMQQLGTRIQVHYNRSQKHFHKYSLRMNPSHFSRDKTHCSFSMVTDWTYIGTQDLGLYRSQQSHCLNLPLDMHTMSPNGIQYCTHQTQRHRILGFPNTKKEIITYLYEFYYLGEGSGRHSHLSLYGLTYSVSDSQFGL